MATVVDEPPEYVIDGLAARGYLTMLVGKRSAFQSFVMIGPLRLETRDQGGGQLGGIVCRWTTTRSTWTPRTGRPCSVGATQ